MKGNKNIEVSKQSWKCYEEGSEGTYTKEDLRRMWNTEIDKSNFVDFESWLAEMEKLQILIRL